MSGWLTGHADPAMRPRGEDTNPSESEVAGCVCLNLTRPTEPSSRRVHAMAVNCWQDSITLRTYLQGPLSPHACFRRQIYPYTMQDDLLSETEDRDYVALHLENEFLHVIVLPELGGKVYSVWDKLARREVFYRNNVVKPMLPTCRRVN